MAKLILTADDFGMSKSTNEAIIDLITKGSLSSTNVMMNMEYIGDAYEIKEHYPFVSLGIHFNITSGKPLSSPKLVSTLIDNNGDFYGSERLRIKLKERLVNMDEVKTELYNQIQKYEEMFGKPDYWNSHENIHMSTRLFKAFIEVAKTKEIYSMRNHYKYLLFQKFNLNVVKVFLKNLIILLFMAYAKVNKMKMPKGSLMFLPNDYRYNIDFIAKKLEKKNKIYEFYIHPSKSIDSKYFGNITLGRIKEYEMLMNDGNLVLLSSKPNEIVKFVK